MRAIKGARPSYDPGAMTLFEARCTTCREKRHGIATREHFVAPVLYRTPDPTHGDRRERDSAASRRLTNGCLS